MCAGRAGVRVCKSAGRVGGVCKSAGRVGGCVSQAGGGRGVMAAAISQRSRDTRSFSPANHCPPRSD